MHSFGGLMLGTCLSGRLQRARSTVSHPPAAPGARSLKGYRWMLWASIVTVLLLVAHCQAQTTGSSSLNGVVTDPSGAVVPGATVEIHNPVSQFDRSTTTDTAGRFTFGNVPFNRYHLAVSVPGFAPYAEDVNVNSAVPLNL